jgi:GH24 family phage-related lysozyme (muramidase)
MANSEKMWGSIASNPVKWSKFQSWFNRVSYEALENPEKKTMLKSAKKFLAQLRIKFVTDWWTNNEQDILKKQDEYFKESKILKDGYTRNRWLITNETKISKNKILKEQKEKTKDINVIKEVTNFIITEEGFSKESYFDFKWYTWWYWTKAPWKNAQITKNKAKTELQKEVSKISDFVKQEFPRLNKNQQVSIISFIYNTGMPMPNNKNLKFLLKNVWKNINWKMITTKLVTNALMDEHDKPGRLLKWLTTRRKKEIKYFWN